MRQVIARNIGIVSHSETLMEVAELRERDPDGSNATRAEPRSQSMVNLANSLVADYRHHWERDRLQRKLVAPKESKSRVRHHLATTIPNRG